MFHTHPFCQPFVAYSVYIPQSFQLPFHNYCYDRFKFSFRTKSGCLFYLSGWMIFVCFSDYIYVVILSTSNFPFSGTSLLDNTLWNTRPTLLFSIYFSRVGPVLKFLRRFLFWFSLTYDSGECRRNCYSCYRTTSQISLFIFPLHSIIFPKYPTGCILFLSTLILSILLLFPLPFLCHVYFIIGVRLELSRHFFLIRVITTSLNSFHFSFFNAF